MTPEMYARFADELAKSLNEKGWSWSMAFEAAGQRTPRGSCTYSYPMECRA